MKTPRFTATLLAFLAINTAIAGESPDRDSTPAALRALPGPGSELRNQDSAFSLLIESYRQMQSFMIEADYEKRLKAAARVQDPKEQAHIIALIEHEHDLRLAKLRDMVAGFIATYDNSRQPNDKVTSASAPSAVDTKTANAKLHTLVPFTPKQFGPSENQPSQLLPAGAQIIYNQQH